MKTTAKKFGKRLRKSMPAVFICACLLALTACGSGGSAENAGESTGAVTQETAQAEKEAEETVTEAASAAETQETKDSYGVGETWEVPGQWRLTVNAVEETDYRNPYSEKDPASVYRITYTYENLGYESASGLMDGLYLDLESGQIVDAGSEMGSSYPATVTFYAKEVPVGAACTAQSCIGVNTSGPFRILLSQYDGNGVQQKVTFALDPEAEPVETDFSDRTLSVPADAYSIGDTWEVEGQWKLTILSVTESEDRNQFSDYDPEAVYIIEYKYENTGYESASGIMDGLYMDLSSEQVVDSHGVMGYSYPGSVSQYATEVPVGASVTAESCIGVEHAGDFELIVVAYDGNSVKQSAAFYLSLE